MLVGLLDSWTSLDIMHGFLISRCLITNLFGHEQNLGLMIIVFEKRLTNFNNNDKIIWKIINSNHKNNFYIKSKQKLYMINNFFSIIVKQKNLCTEN